MRLLLPLLVLPLVGLIAGCAEKGYLLDHTVPTKTAFIVPELVRFGFEAREAQCVAGRLGANLSIWQLRQFRQATAAAVLASGPSARLNKQSLWVVASGIRDPKTPGEVARAIEGCGVASDLSPPPPPGTMTLPAAPPVAPTAEAPDKVQNGPLNYEPSENLLRALDAYERGDFPAAARLARVAADAGDSGAQQFLGGLYASGRGVTADPVHAARYFRLAADQGWSEAMNNLGKAFETGQGVPRDLVEASKWYLLASARATEDEQMVARNRENLLRQMTLEQIQKAAELARQWERARR